MMAADWEEDHYVVGYPYHKLSMMAVGTPCQLNANDTRALYRMSQWMRAYGQIQRGGFLPPTPKGETAAEAYYMVSFFKELSKKYVKNPSALSAVNALFDKVIIPILKIVVVILLLIIPLLIITKHRSDNNDYFYYRSVITRKRTWKPKKRLPQFPKNAPLDRWTIQ